MTHDRDEAAAIADAIAVLHAGCLRQHGAAGLVLDNPADAECARTLGFENVLPVALATALIGASAPVALRAGDREVGEAGTPGGIPARLRRVVPLGPSARVMAEVGGCAVHATASMPLPGWLGRTAPGDGVALLIRAERARPLGAGSPRETGLVALGSATNGGRKS